MFCLSFHSLCLSFSLLKCINTQTGIHLNIRLKLSILYFVYLQIMNRSRWAFINWCEIVNMAWIYSITVTCIARKCNSPEVRIGYVRRHRFVMLKTNWWCVRDDSSHLTMAHLRKAENYTIIRHNAIQFFRMTSNRSRSIWISDMTPRCIGLQFENKDRRASVNYI